VIIRNENKDILNEISIKHTGNGSKLVIIIDYPLYYPKKSG
jgi:hypothetical protein